MRGVPWHAALADDSTVEQAVQQAGDQDVRLSLSQLANHRQEHSARRGIPEEQTKPFHVGAVFS